MDASSKKGNIGKPGTSAKTTSMTVRMAITLG
jgi:hypothetical protein